MPKAAASRRTSAGKCSVSSQWSALGARRSSAKDFAMSRTARWSAVKANMRFPDCAPLCLSGTLPDVCARRNQRDGSLAARPISNVAGAVGFAKFAGVDLDRLIAQPPYAHLGSFSDLVTAAKAQKPLLPIAPPGEETRRSAWECFGFTAQASGARLERSWRVDSADGEEISWSVGFGPPTHA